MPPKQKTVNELLEELTEAVQNLFILQALEAGATAESVRALLRVDKLRVNAVSKIRKKRKAAKDVRTCH